MDEDDDELIKFLIDMGIIEPMGIGEGTQDELFYVTDKAQEAFPQLVEQQEKFINDAVFKLWQLGFLEVVFNDDGEVLVGLNQNSTKLDEVGNIEDEELKKAMLGILLIFGEKFGGSGTTK